MRKRRIETAIFLVLLSVSLGARADVPDWMRALARQTAKTYADDVKAVILLSEDET